MGEQLARVGGPGEVVRRPPVDPLGRTGIRSEYDDDGRLQKIFSAPRKIFEIDELIYRDDLNSVGMMGGPVPASPALVHSVCGACRVTAAG